MTATATAMRPAGTTRDALKLAGNPFRNYFARNPDDDICGRFHVPELFVAERELLHAIIDLHRADASAHSEVVPVLGNKGAGKTHLLHSIKHGAGGAWQLLVTPGVFQKDTDFLEYLLFQIVDTLLGGGKQKGVRPLEHVGEQLVRGLLANALRQLGGDEKVELFPPPGIGRWARRLGIGHAQAAERCEWLADALARKTATPVLHALADAGLAPDRAFDLLVAHVGKTEPHNATGLMRRSVIAGFAKAALLKDEGELANFLTFGFTEIDFQVRPTRQDLVLALFKVLMQLLRERKIPVVVAFDQLEDLLLARRNDDCHRVAEAFFAGIVQVMHQIDGLCFLIFAERGLWNRFVPSLDGYIQDRLNNPVHVPGFGTVKTLRLEAPPAALVRRVVEARLRPVLDQLPAVADRSDIYPFTEDQIAQAARTEPTLRDMLQQFRHLYDHVVSEEYGTTRIEPVENFVRGAFADDDVVPLLPESRLPAIEAPASRIGALLGFEDSYEVKAAEIITAEPATESPRGAISPAALADMWDTEFRSARRKLEPDGALTGASRELQSALGSFLTACHEHGVKVGPWRLQHVVPEWSFGDHPTYGVVSLAHWACKDGQPWKVGVGLFLAKGPGKPKDLEIKLAAMDVQPTVVDHLILMRTEDDLALTGKSKTLWGDAQKRGHHARLEAVTLDAFAMVYSFPRWLAAVRESLSEGTPLPNLADLIQEKCERLLEQVCMPVQG
jgi:hypothetical protein